MNIEKWPRWALVGLVACLMLVCGFFTNRAVADGDKVKKVAYEAWGMANDLKVQIADVRGAQQTFKIEYREDQRELDRKLTELLRAVKQ